MYIEGKLQTRKWQEKSGTYRYATEIAARDERCWMAGEAVARDVAPEPGPPTNFKDDVPF